MCCLCLYFSLSLSLLIAWDNIWGNDPWCLCLCFIFFCVCLCFCLFFFVFFLCLCLHLSLFMTKMTWHNIWGYEKGDPRHDDKKTGGEVIRDDVGHHVPLKSLQHLVFNLI